MSDESGDVERKVATEIKNVIEADAQNPVAVAVADDESPMLKIYIDGFEEILEYLSTTDILSLRQTCKCLQKVIDNYIKGKLPAIKVGYGKEILHKDCKLPSSCAKLIKQITVCSSAVDIGSIGKIEDILGNVEKLIVSGTLELESRKTLLQCCTSLKYLSCPYIRGRMVGNENEWLLQTYPTLEHLEMVDMDHSDEMSMPELKIFLELNPNVRRFSTFSTLPLKLMLQSLLGSKVKLDQLDIAVNCLLTEMVDCLDLLNRLYDEGVYKRLHFYARFIYNTDEINQIASVSGLEKLYLAVVMTSPSLPHLPELKEFCIMMDEDPDEAFSFETVAKDLVNVERVYLRLVDSDQLTQLIRHAPKVKEIKVEQLVEGTYFERLVIDLPALNNERKQLAGACKITLYVDDFVFVTTKYALFQTDFSKIELKRADAVEWEHSIFY
ncbi:uncharacterized protein LOC116348765 [Contarinia nasturtii]|uniref:uncharacterized protein LOC116348765 n=1 Tax=Contarinia nasturtii TaxID=265458 RepID=UPI0012D47515|nr:uncharacterized protein LOC116348765 [Contarinia nasturtii]